MGAGLLIGVVVLQLVMLIGVMLFLKRSLHRELLKVALEKFEVLRVQEDLTQLKEIVVISHESLSEPMSSQFKKIAAKRFKGVPIRFLIDASLEGGIKIVAGSVVIDDSVKNRFHTGLRGDI